MGGEKANGSDAPDDDEGSPPHGRGKDPHPDVQGIVRGITPAWAGKRFWNRPWVWATSDHPRVGGEKPNQWRQEIACQGSPPRGRGKGIAQRQSSVFVRITPAWAGKSWPQWRRRCPEWDHPRVGGEKPAGRFLLRLDTGSPPHGRGKGDFHIVTHTKVGITPAWAGKRFPARMQKKRKQDHPRVGGEKRTPDTPLSDTEGSPPRRRGKVFPFGRRICFSGITPA